MRFFQRRSERTGDDYGEQRRRMVAKQLRSRDIRDARVLAAMEKVPRERFLPEDRRERAYHDGALAIDCEQTISQPYVVAAMTQALELTGGERVLEIGTGSGYQTAVLAELAAEVVSVERHQPLLEAARSLLDELGYDNIRCHLGDGSQGWPPGAPYDRIIVTAAAESCPAPLWEQLAEGGILVGPFGAEDSQVLQVLRKHQGKRLDVTLFPVRFVPLVSEV